MAEITAEMVKLLREATNAGVLDCKKALTETNGAQSLCDPPGSDTSLCGYIPVPLRYGTANSRSDDNHSEEWYGPAAYPSGFYLQINCFCALRCVALSAIASKRFVI